jgi:DNA-binding winged helix-turn-helix (wHTH) protein/Tol biopolymer transport system component
MNGPSKRGPLIRFSVFELDLDSGELFKQGRKIKLQGQPFELLVALLERPGEVVTRDELQQKVWPSDTVVDFDRGLNRAINKVRDALGDSAESPLFIETLPRRGYRFIGSILPDNPSSVPATQAAGVPPLPPPSAVRRPSKTVPWVLSAAAVTAALLAIWVILRAPAGRGEVRVQQLTTNSAENPLWHAVISPDGKYLAYGDLAGIQIRVIRTGESHLLAKPAALPADAAWFPAAWFPDGTRLLATSQKLDDVAAWAVPVIGSAAAPLRENALVQSVSPDESLIAFTSGGHFTSYGSPIDRRLMLDSEIWVMGARGENARKVLAGGGAAYFGSVRWSSGGQRIAYQKVRRAEGMLWDYSIETCDLNGGTPSVVLSSRVLNFMPGMADDVSFPDDIAWLPDGRIVYAMRENAPNARDRNLWQIPVDSKSGSPRGQPRRITNLSGFHMEGFSIAGDGKRLVFESGIDQSHVLVGNLEGGKLGNPRRLTLDERYNIPFAWTPDSKAVIFNSDRSGTFSIYKQGLDQQVPELIPTGSENIQVARAAPDGAWLNYTALFPAESNTVRMMRVPLAGGAPQRIFETTANNFDCPAHSGLQCVLSEQNSRHETILTGFDPTSGVRHELFRVAPVTDGRAISGTINWTVSPDGTHIAMTGSDSQGRVEIRSLRGEIENRVEIKGWLNPLSVDWAADGKSVFVSSPGLIESHSGPIGATLLRVDLDGHVQPLWETRGGRYTWAIASPNGKYLAIREPATERNAWMLENF